MTKADTLIHAKWIIPVEPEHTVYTNYSIAIKDGNIVAILPTVDAQKKYRANEEHQLEQHAVIPGLINAHTHAAMNLFRGLANDLPLMDWLNNHIWPAEGKWVSPEFVKDGTKLAVAEMLRGGTTYSGSLCQCRHACRCWFNPDRLPYRLGRERRRIYR